MGDEGELLPGMTGERPGAGCLEAGGMSGRCVGAGVTGRGLGGRTGGRIVLESRGSAWGLAGAEFT